MFPFAYKRTNRQADANQTHAPQPTMATNGTSEANVAEKEYIPPTERSSPSSLQTLASVAGNVLEWYDFAVFGFFDDIIGELFFPPQEGDASTLEAFAVFGGAFIMRPSESVPCLVLSCPVLSCPVLLYMCVCMCAG